MIPPVFKDANGVTQLVFKSTKTFTHSTGLSVAFRQPGATHSHCKDVHGYSLLVKFTFEAVDLDDNNWVVDFGGMKAVKQWLDETFDHKTLISIDDPHVQHFRELHDKGVLNLIVVERVGMEAFAAMIYYHAELWLIANGHGSRVLLSKVEVREHEANGASVEPIRIGYWT